MSNSSGDGFSGTEAAIIYSMDKKEEIDRRIDQRETNDKKGMAARAVTAPSGFRRKIPTTMVGVTNNQQRGEGGQHWWSQRERTAKAGEGKK